MNQHITILVVDDDASLCHLTRLLLVQYGYGALHALSAEAAIHVSNRHPGQIDLLLADIAMALQAGPNSLKTSASHGQISGYYLCRAW